MFTVYMYYLKNFAHSLFVSKQNGIWNVTCLASVSKRGQVLTVSESFYGE